MIVAKGGVTSAVVLREGIGARRGRGRRARGARRLAVVGEVAGRRRRRLPRRAGQRRRRRPAREPRGRPRERIAPVLTPFRELLEERRAAGAAAGAFTCYDVTTACGVVRAAEERDVPAILLVAEASFRADAGRLLLPALVTVAERADCADVRPARPRRRRHVDRRGTDRGRRSGDGRRLAAAARGEHCLGGGGRGPRGRGGRRGGARAHRGRRGRRARGRGGAADRSGRGGAVRGGDAMRLSRGLDRQRPRPVRRASAARLGAPRARSARSSTSRSRCTARQVFPRTTCDTRCRSASAR